MCIDIYSVTVTNKPIIAYKRVIKINARTGKSCIRYRARQDGAKSNGTWLDYRIGETVESGDPGIYLFARKPRRRVLVDYHYLCVEIPEGTVIARGIDVNKEACILAERINVLGWLHPARG